MMAKQLNSRVEKVILRSLDYIESENYKGWDPYDLLNSPILNKSFLYKTDFFRLLMIQIGKRSPINIRDALGVKKDYNAKGISLILDGYINLYHLASDNLINLDKNILTEKINFLASMLIDLSSGYSGTAWGYNFPWQARTLLFSFKYSYSCSIFLCVQSLFKAFDITGNESYKANALSHADFILNDLSRTHDSKGNFILSYSPINGNNRVINASLLGAKSLAYCYQYSQKSYYKDVAKKIIEFVIQYQEEDGSWIYGLDNNQGWKDSFHTGYNLEALKYYENFVMTHHLKIT